MGVILYKHDIYSISSVEQHISIWLNYINQLEFVYMTDTIEITITKIITNKKVSYRFYNRKCTTDNQIYYILSKEKIYEHIEKDYPELDKKFIDDYFNFDKFKIKDIKNIQGKYRYDFSGDSFIISKVINESPIEEIVMLIIRYEFKIRKYYAFNYLIKKPKFFDTIDEMHEYIKELKCDDIISKKKLNDFGNFILIHKLKGD